VLESQFSRQISDFISNNPSVEVQDVKSDRIQFKYKLEKTKVIEILAILPKHFPVKLPDFYLLNRHSYGRLAHVGWSKESGLNGQGKICEGVSISLNVDYQSPCEVFEFALNRSIEQLRSVMSNSRQNEKEILEEFAGHWRFIPNVRRRADIIVTGSTNSIQTLSVKASYGIQRVYITNDSELCDAYGLSKAFGSFLNKGIYIPFNKEIFPPRPGQSIETWWTQEGITQLKEQRVEISRLLGRGVRKYKKFSVVFSVPTSNGNKAWAGFDLASPKKRNQYHYLTST